VERCRNGNPKLQGNFVQYAERLPEEFGVLAMRDALAVVRNLLSLPPAQAWLKKARQRGLITVEQFLRFRKNHEYRRQYAPDPDCPVNDVSWYDAAAYCNWLSQQEGIPEHQWCYLPNSRGEYSDGMKLAPGYLKRTGYRLPTAAEWEYGCRAGAGTSRYYGETEELLDAYAWSTKHSLGRRLLPAGSLKPNDLGLFDMLGNVLEWNQESAVNSSLGEREGPSEGGEPQEIKDKLVRLLRGGSFRDPPENVRSAYCRQDVPTNRVFNVGFRVARTFR
jgi:formylglycine-generating enzyme required for sulfatase activity